MLSLYRRHLKTCPHRHKGRAFAKCSCPIWCDGELHGERCRQSLKTRDWQRAIRLVDRLEHPNSGRSDLIPCAQLGCNVRVESGRCDLHRQTVPKAMEAYFVTHTDCAHGTLRNYRRSLRELEEHLTGLGVVWVDEVLADMIHSLRVVRGISPLTWVKELEILRGFFRFCMARKWISESPATREAGVKVPKNIQPTDKEPFTRDEVIKILTACDVLGQRPYERLRARAYVLLFRYTALRISDVALLQKDRIRRGEVYLRTLKNGKVVKLPVPPELQAALDMLPEPIAAGSSKYFFWSGNGTRRSFIRDVDRTMSRVFELSGVPSAHAHRFRHTLATEMLEKGGTYEEVADVLGNSLNVVKKHYAKWSVGRQERISSLLSSIFGTPLVHQTLSLVSDRKQ